MPVEIERKFLVRGEGWRTDRPRHLAQGYLNLDERRTVRVRTDGDAGYLTVKGLTSGASRPEYEYPIPIGDAEEMLRMCEGSIVEKLRHVVVVEGFRWEVDEFLRDNRGLVVAEIELESENQAFPHPGWLGTEVTHDPRYFNSSLAKAPWRTWGFSPADGEVKPTSGSPAGADR